MNQKLINFKSVFQRKDDILGTEKPQFKTRLIAKFFNQKEGFNFNHMFSLLVKRTSIRITLSIIIKFDL